MARKYKSINVYNKVEQKYVCATLWYILVFLSRLSGTSINPHKQTTTSLLM